MSKRLANKVALVTGASSGVGKEISLLFAKEGATVYAVARRENKLKELAEIADSFEGEIIPMPGDLSDPSDSKTLVDRVFKKANKLDILINNAGIMDDFSGIASTTDEMWDKVMNLNLTSVFHTTRSAVNIFVENGGGNIVNIGSIGGITGGKAGLAYTCSKHALIGLTKNTAVIYLNDNIRTNLIAPGGIETEVSQGEFMQNINIEDFERTSAGMDFKVRVSNPIEIANAALFLASDESSFINGEILIADGGLTSF